MKKMLYIALAMCCIALPAMAGVINWSETMPGTVDQSQTDKGYTSWGLYRNLYGWDRNVSMWQEFTAGTSGDLGGIALSFRSAKASGSFDLNIYAGTGVEGTLLQNTPVSWSTSPSFNLGDWYTFQLDTPVALTAGTHYTFSIENLSSDSAFTFNVSSSSSDPYTGGVYMHQGYQMPNQYHSGGTAKDSAFKTVMIPEPASIALISLTAGLGLFARRIFQM